MGLGPKGDLHELRAHRRGMTGEDDVAGRLDDVVADLDADGRRGSEKKRVPGDVCHQPAVQELGLGDDVPLIGEKRPRGDVGRRVGPPDVVVTEKTVGARVLVAPLDGVPHFQELVMDLVKKVVPEENIRHREQVVEDVRGHGPVHFVDVVGPAKIR
jgi:hypothetical protein